MPAAARLGDPTSHGNPLTSAAGTASLTVFVGGQPAWRAQVDVHVCPLVNGVQPHVGGVVAMGSTSVRIEKMPAARQGDQIVEAGGPNVIAAGFPAVIIGG